MPWYEYASRSAKQIKEIVAGDKAVAVLPVGAIEQHGPHMPVGTDSYISQAYTRMALDKVGDTGATFLMLPGITYALSVEHIHFPGTITLQPTTLLATLEDIGASLARTGFKTLVIINGHGGNDHILQIAARQIHLTGINVYTVNNASIVQRMGAKPYWIHADKRETSTMLALFPDYVNMSAAVPALDKSVDKWAALADFKSDLIETWFTEDYAVDGVIGDASRADAEFGTEWLDGMTDGIAGALKHVAKMA